MGICGDIFDEFDCCIDFCVECFISVGIEIIGL